MSQRGARPNIGNIRIEWECCWRKGKLSEWHLSYSQGSRKDAEWTRERKKKASGSTFKASSCYVWWSYICEFEQLNWKQQLWLLERGQSATSLKSTGMTGWPGFMLKAFFSQLTGKCYLEQYNTDYIHATQSTTANTGVLQLQLWDVSLFCACKG